MTAPSATELDYRPSYLAAGIAALAVLLLYLVTLAPSTAMWDTSEYITAAYVLGLPHPPGNPFFVLIGRVASILPIAPTVATRINVLAALASAVSAGMWFLITERVLVHWFAQRWTRLVVAGMSAVIGSTAFTVWNQSVVNEKVYTISLVGLAICSWLTVRWCDEPDGRRADRILVLVAYLCGLGYTNHMAGMLAGPAIAIAVVVRRPRTLLRWKLLTAILGALLLGGSVFATQPIRAAHNPALNEGDPTACRAGLKLDCTFSKGTYDAFMYNFNRGQYGKPDLGARQAPLSAQVGMWWLYFKWQWWRDGDSTMPGLQTALAVIYLLLGLLGGYVHWQRDRRSFSFFGPLMFTLSLLLIYYLNFKYGASQSPELQDSVNREVRDRDYFYLWSFSAWSVWAALGLAFVWETVSQLAQSETVVVGRESLTNPTRKGWMMGLPVLLIAFVPAIGNAKWASRAGETDTRDFAHDILNSVEPYGVLVTVGDNDTFPLWYAQEVEGIRKDIVIANTSLLNTEWYTRQIIRRPVYDYDAAAGPALYRDKKWVKPAKGPINMTLDEADKVPLYVDLQQPQLFQKGEVVATIDPKQLQHGFLERADIFVLRMIQDAFPERPIYFARTSAGYGESMGLGQYLLTQGLARKLMPQPIKASKDTLQLPGQGFLDVKTTKTLWKDVFVGQAAIIKKGHWVDRPSVGIPYLYVSTGLLLTEALRVSGDPEYAPTVMGTTRQLAKATGLGDLAPDPVAPAQSPIPLGGDTAVRTSAPKATTKPAAKPKKP
jgi:hypothetical protein